MELKIEIHAVTGRRMVEVFDNAGHFVAAVYPDDEKNGVKIVSHHFHQHWHDDGGRSCPAVPTVNITFKK